MPDTKLEALIVQGANLIPLSALLSLPSGFYDGRWIDSDSIAALVEECVRMTPPQAEVQAEPVAFTLDDSELEDLAHAANQEALSFGVSLDPFLRLAKTVRAKCTAPQAQPADALDADQPEPADLWYLQDTRGYVGNDVLWWAKDGNGYTTDISKAHAYTRDEAFQQAAMRGTDRAWPKAYIDGKTRPAVDMQYIDHQAAMAAAQEGGNAAMEA